MVQGQEVNFRMCSRLPDIRPGRGVNGPTPVFNVSGTHRPDGGCIRNQALPCIIGGRRVIGVRSLGGSTWAGILLFHVLCTLSPTPILAQKEAWN
jgi:hypothetical protein